MSEPLRPPEKEDPLKREKARAIVDGVVQSFPRRKGVDVSDLIAGAVSRQIPIGDDVLLWYAIQYMYHKAKRHGCGPGATDHVCAWRGGKDPASQ